MLWKVLNPRFKPAIVILIPLLAGITGNIYAEADNGLKFSGFEHISFSRIPANSIETTDKRVRFDVNASASFLMTAFDHVVPVKEVSVTWRSDGVPSVRNAQQEMEKAGDDAVVKVGLLLRADEPGFHPFLPAWMRRVKQKLAYPSEIMYYLVADARHMPGQRWDNPYNRRVTMMAMNDEKNADGWTTSRMKFDAPLEVVAVWLMADGDNTGSSFSSEVRQIELR
jgi:hypothetical protein